MVHIKVTTLRRTPLKACIAGCFRVKSILKYLVPFNQLFTRWKTAVRSNWNIEDDEKEKKSFVLGLFFIYWKAIISEISQCKIVSKSYIFFIILYRKWKRLRCVVLVLCFGMIVIYLIHYVYSRRKCIMNLNGSMVINGLFSEL